MDLKDALLTALDHAEKQERDVPKCLVCGGTRPRDTEHIEHNALCWLGDLLALYREHMKGHKRELWVLRIDRWPSIDTLANPFTPGPIIDHMDGLDAETRRISSGMTYTSTLPAPRMEEPGTMFLVCQKARQSTAKIELDECRSCKFYVGDTGSCDLNLPVRQGWNECKSFELRVRFVASQPLGPGPGMEDIELFKHTGLFHRHGGNPILTSAPGPDSDKEEDE